MTFFHLCQGSQVQLCNKEQQNKMGTNNISNLEVSNDTILTCQRNRLSIYACKKVINIQVLCLEDVFFLIFILLQYSANILARLFFFFFQTSLMYFTLILYLFLVPNDSVFIRYFCYFFIKQTIVVPSAFS